MKEQSGRKAGMLMDKTVFGYFKHFVSDDDEARVKGACGLIEFLCNGQKNKPHNGTDDAEEESVVPKTAETAYALKRLVRGVGSMQNDSRIGFFTALVGLLERLRGREDECPSVTELFTLVKSELTESELGEGEEEKHKTPLELRIGKILVCGAIIKSGLIDDASELELQTVLKTLKKDMYKMLVPLVYTFLNELANRLEASKFSKVFWPVFEPVLNVPKEKHTIDSAFFLLQLSTGPHKKLINQKYFERNFSAPKLLHEHNFPFLAQLLFGIGSTMGINHPFYECLLRELNKQNTLVPFWRDAIVPVLEQENRSSKPKHRDIIVLRLVVSVFNLLEDGTLVPEVLQPAFVKFLVNNLKNRNKYSEDVRNLYQEVCAALLQTYPKMQDESARLETLRRLMHAPGSVLIEKYANCKLLHNLLTTLSAESLRTVGSELKATILDEAGTGTNGERSYAAYMLQRLLSLRQLTTQSDDKGQAEGWHQEVVKFLLTLGVFYSADGVSVLKASKQDKALSAELAKTMRGLFFSSLQHRHPKLSVERAFLLSIVRHVDEVMRAHGTKCLRSALTDEQMSCWNKMFATVTSESSPVGKKQKSKKRPSIGDAAETQCDTVFHILLMHMGLHLFSDPEVACSSIEELECVMKRIEEKAKQRRQGSNGDANAGSKKKRASELTIELEPAEPEWIEVVVDLFLNLLSQNSHLLRNVIAHLFPHLSSEITLPALNQILSVINLKDKSNPLTVPGDEDESEAEEVEDDENGSSDSGEEEDEEEEDEEESVKKHAANGDGNEEDDEEDDEDDDEDIMGDEEEEDNITDTMRAAIQTALGGANPETDTESVDLDEMDEEQGRRLDQALTAAFRAFRKKQSARKRKGPTKAEKQMDIVLTHFRMRVLDLVDAYLKHEPDMLLCLELMLYIFEMLPVALREESKYESILTRYRQIFTTLNRIKKFKRDAEDVRPEQLEQILRDLIEKVAKGAAFPERNEYLLKACQFIVICSQVLGKEAAAGGASGPNAVDRMFGELLEEFITNRNPSLAFSAFQSLFQMQWSGVWHLTGKLVHGGLQVGTVRAIRRIQTLQLLRELLRNRRLLNADQARAAGELRTICSDGIAPYVAQLEAAVVAGDRTIGQNELYELLLVLSEVHHLPSHLAAAPSVAGSNGKKVAKNQQQSLLNWETIGTQIQSMRLFALNAQTMATYRQFCNRWHLKPISNDGLPLLKENGLNAVEATNDEKLTTNGAGGGTNVSKKGKGKKQKTTNGEEDEEEEKEEEDAPHLLNGHSANDDSSAAEEETDERGGKAKRKQKKGKATNGHSAANGNAQEEEQHNDENGEERMEVTEEPTNRKRKNDKILQNGAASEDGVSSKMEKRRRKEALLQAASEGMEEFSFARAIQIE
ncbi:myb-binding protein 1A [Anopheles merus]|uniref:Myb-binding protein 1A n=1 Tax=Anopheles merus TaxID=30066 RepID=A0A182VPA5_ANOME|nr:myb-binding protein 1A [Anopheles merus]